MSPNSRREIFAIPNNVFSILRAEEGRKTVMLEAALTETSACCYKAK